MWSWLTYFHSTPNIFSLDMWLLSVKRLQKVCFFVLLVTWMTICISNIYPRLDNVNTSLNIVTEYLIPIKQAHCVKYTNNTLYSTNGKLTISCDSGSSINHIVGLSVWSFPIMCNVLSLKLHGVPWDMAWDTYKVLIFFETLFIF